MKTRMIMLGVAITLMVAMAGCGKENKKAEIGTEIADTGAGWDDASEETVEEFAKDATIEETVLYDENDVKITATDLNYGNYSANLEVTIENNSDEKLSFVSESVSCAQNAINGFMISDGYVNCDVESKGSTTEEMSFDYNTLMLYGITEIADIQIGFSMTDDDFNSTDTGVLQLKTSAADSYDYEAGSERYHKAITNKILLQNYDLKVPYFADDELYSSNGIRLVSEVFAVNSSDERSLLLEVRNETDKTVYVQTSNIKANDIEIYDSDWSYDTITAGNTAIVNIGLDDILDAEEWTENGIDTIESISMTIGVENSDGMLITEKKEITIPLKDVDGTKNTSVKKQNDAEDTKVSEETTPKKDDDASETKDTASDQVNPEFKEMMDSYEAFFDEYVEFMKKYNNSDDVLSMMDDYSDYLTKYTDYMDKLYNVDAENMSEADAYYYVEVSTRILDKLKEIN